MLLEIGKAGIMLGQVAHHVSQGHIDWGKIINLVNRFGVDSLLIVSLSVLTAIGAAVAIYSGHLFTELLVGVAPQVFWSSAKFGVMTRDVVNMLVKSLFFSVAIALIACHKGLTTRGGSEAVGKSITQTVVWCFLSVFLVNH